MHLDRLKRREFITLLGGTAAGWPLAAAALASEASGQRGDSKVRAPDTRPEPGSSVRVAQQSERVRRIGVLINVAADDPEGHARITAFAQGLQEAGWSTGRNVRIDYRWGGAGVEAMAKYA